MLIGKSTNVIDAKGRLFVPVKWRVDLTDDIILLVGFGTSDEEKYLQAMSRSRFSEITALVNKLPPTDLTFIKAKRFVFPNAEECPLDKQGRIFIPAELLKYAKISGEARLLGAGDSVQIWNPSILEEVENAYGFDEFASDLQSLAEKAQA